MICGEDDYKEMLKEEYWLQKYLLVQQSKELGVHFSKEDFSLSEIQIFSEIKATIQKFSERKSNNGKSKISL